jgi:hypothetical protein
MVYPHNMSNRPQHSGFPLFQMATNFLGDTMLKNHSAAPRPCTGSYWGEGLECEKARLRVVGAGTIHVGNPTAQTAYP